MFQIVHNLKNTLKKEDGMEMLQVLLIAGIVLVLIVMVFYPAIDSFFDTMIDTITSWFSSKGSAPFK